MKVNLMVLIVLIHTTCNGQKNAKEMNNKDSFKIEKSDLEWRKSLTPLEYCITRQKGTESPFTGKYYNFFKKGYYECIGCHTIIFTSETKFHSGSGWPSFYDVFDSNNILLTKDTTLNMNRTEISCASCGSHLGHVFNDGTGSTGLRYCINSAALKFIDNKNQPIKLASEEE